MRTEGWLAKKFSAIMSACATPSGLG
jgi:hypothetical protein